MAPVWVNYVENGLINPLDRGVAYGDGVFATMRTASADMLAEVLFLAEHIARVQQSCERLGIEWHASNQLLQQLNQLAQQYPQHCIKLLLTRGVGGRGYQAPLSANVTEVLSVHPIPEHYLDWQQTGISLASSPIFLGRQPLLAGIKHLNRLEQVLIKSQPLSSHHQDWLVFDCDGNVIESSIANIFIVKNDQVFTPAITHAGVSGVMREVMIDSLLGHDIAVMATQLTIGDIQTADHIFITNSLFGIIDVAAIDDFQFSRWTQTSRFRHVLSVNLSS
ncbi:aminodeoxychorismate lyase [Shewanella polaris]|uniref:Aminodeoxychorismate lyase n=1 Tax=Shewanella polaris TaxID=2588449 RepID=A0A4Y5YFD0_9GAMM|nr:aminodeoxychorismate lyase [Shewanella polaris]QDE31491.1 aminodeoxychorismate lyase [Shewanella polaris]